MADLFQNLISAEWCEVRVLNRKLYAILFHVDTSDTVITMSGDDFCSYLSTNYAGAVVAAAGWDRPAVPGVIGYTIDEQDSNYKLSAIVTQGVVTRAEQVYLQSYISAEWRPVFGAQETTGYGEHTLDPVIGIAIGSGYDHICVLGNTLNIGFAYPDYPGRYLDVGAIPASTILPGEPNSATHGHTFTVVPNTTLYANMDGIISRTALDPYEWGVGESEPGGFGDGTFDFSSTPIDFQGLPGIGAMDTGMVSLYVPSASDLRGLAQYLWAGAFDVENFKKLVADPMDTIIGMHIVPLTAAQIGTTASTLVVGNISTGLSMPKATSQYVAVDCGSITIDRKWGAYLDYSPYSKLQLFLPYIGFVDISPDDCMGGTIAVRYSIDILGGTCVAQVKCNDHVLYELSGNCSCEVPVTAGQYQNIALSLTRGIGAIAGGVASGNYAGSVEGVANAALSAVKPEVQRSGGFGGSSGLMGHQIPFLILTVPRLCVPGKQATYIGYPSFITRTMGELEGYNAVEVSHLEGMSCTQAEADMIIAALAEGVIF